MAKVAYLVTDLLFTSKIREVAKQLGVEVAAARDAAALVAAARDAQLVILDLRLPAAFDALLRLSSDPSPSASPPARIGFVDHERTDVMEAARAHGCRAYAKGAFTKELPSLLAAL